MSRGEQALTGRVRDLGRSGDGVVVTDAGIIFVRGALPKELVRIAAHRKKGGIRRGRLVEVLEPSPDRVDPPCALAARCGGCPLMILSSDAQRTHKASVAAWATGVETPMYAPGPLLAYRRRARFAFAAGRLGYRYGGGKTVVDVETCPVVEPALATALVDVRDRLLPFLGGAGEVVLARGEGAAVAWLKSDATQPPAVYEAARALVSEGRLRGAVLAIGGAAPAVFGEPEERTDGHDGAPSRGAPFGFAQAHANVNTALVDTVVDWARPAGAQVVELYAGNGNLTVALADGAASLLAVEQSSEAVKMCRENLSSRGLGAVVVEADAKEGATRQRRADVVVLDPPRTGAREALEPIAALAPDRIIYVSCDPPTLRRDLESLADLGYVVRKAAAFDMFPQTAHLEIVVQLGRDLDREAG